MADTNLTLYEIECALAISNDFNFVRNLVVFNVNGASEILPIHHECDMLVCSKAGYLSEIEIKRSYADFLADFKKRHDHTNPLIKYFYYAVPESIYDKVEKKLSEENRRCGIVTYREDGWITVKRKCPTLSYTKLFLEQKLELARLGCLRVIGLKQKITELRKEKENAKDNANAGSTEAVG